MNINQRLESGQLQPRRGLRLKNKITGVDVISRFAWSPGGERIAVGYPSKLLEIVEVESGARQTLKLDVPDDYLHFNSISWSYDGKLIAAAYQDAHIRVWDIQTGDYKTLSRHLTSVNSVAFSPNERLLLSAGSDRLLLLWDLKNFPLGYNSLDIIKSFGGHHAQINRVAWSHRGDRFASAGADGQLLLWSPHDQKLLRQVAKVEYPINSVAWTMGDVDLVTAGGTPLINIWSVESEHRREAKPGHVKSVRDACTCYYPLMASKSTRDDKVILWRTDLWDPVGEIIEGPSRFHGPGPAFHPSANMLATLGDNDTEIAIWEFDLTNLYRPGAGRREEVAEAPDKMRERELAGDYDVFLCYNSADQDMVVEIAKDLKKNRLVPFLDIWHLKPGRRWQDEIMKVIDKIRVAAIFLGPNGSGAWQDFETLNLVNYAVTRGYTIIPVFLPGYPKDKEADPKLNQFQHVDFNQYGKEEPLDKLIWGISTGRDEDGSKPLK